MIPSKIQDLRIRWRVVSTPMIGPRTTEQSTNSITNPPAVDGER